MRGVEPARRGAIAGALRHAGAVAVRDRGSSALLSELGVEHRLLPDAVHALGAIEPAAAEGADETAILQISRARLRMLGHARMAAAPAGSPQLAGRPIRLLLAGTATGHDSADDYERVVRAARRVARGIDIAVLEERRPLALAGHIARVTDALRASGVQVFLHSLRDGSEYLLPATTVLDLGEDPMTARPLLRARVHSSLATVAVAGFLARPLGAPQRHPGRPELGRRRPRDRLGGRRAGRPAAPDPRAPRARPADRRPGTRARHPRPVEDGQGRAQARGSSSNSLIRRRSARFARRIARSISPAPTFAKPEGSPRLRSAIRVPTPASSNV